MKTSVLIAVTLLSLTCSIASSRADTVSGINDPPVILNKPSLKTSGSAGSAESATLAAPLRQAIVAPAVAAPTQTMNVADQTPDQTPRKHMRIGLPGLFHVNF